tara:strand:- start:4673 stop:6739 length:2067 start_codon:yes stop_codon:yes gene_type:complete
MGFLFPLYLLGALALAVPVLLHLRRRPPKDRVIFSSLMFLDPQTPQRKQRNQLENLILLALRCLALLLLALLFSRPFFRDPDALAVANQGSTSVLLVDRSASMQREGMWDQVREIAGEVLDRSRPEDRIAVIAFDGASETLLSFEDWTNLPVGGRPVAAKARLEGTSVTWQRTSLDQALIEAVGQIEDETKGRLGTKQIVLISDLQEGATRSALDSFAWPEEIEVQLRPVVPAQTENAAAHLVAKLQTEDDEEASDSHLLRVRVTNSESSTRESFTLGWEGDPASTIDLLVPPGATRVVIAPPRPNPESRFVELKGDSDSFDNRIYVALPEARPVDVLFVGPNVDPSDTRSPLFYLQRALSPTETLAPQLRTSTDNDLSRDQCLTADVVVLSGRLSAEQSEWVNEFLRNGGVVFSALSKGEKAQRFVEAVGVKVREAEVSDYAMLEGLDFEHPVLRPFAAPGLRDFSKIHYWKHRSLDLTDVNPDQISILANYDSGDPAVVEFKLDRGRVFLFASDWTPEESQLALSSKFVPLIYSMLSVSGFDSDARRQFYVGDQLPNFEEETNLFRPDGSLAARNESAELPGIYLAKTGAQTSSIAANIPFEESRLEVLLPEDFVTQGITLMGGNGERSASGENSDRVRLETIELEAQQKVWKWLILLAVAILLGETWLANGGLERILAARKPATT